MYYDPETHEYYELIEEASKLLSLLCLCCRRFMYFLDGQSVCKTPEA